MSKLMAIHSRTGLPMFFDESAGHYRVCGRVQTQRPKLKVQKFAEYLLEKHDTTAPNLLSSISDYDRYQTGVPILDQGQVGSCVAHGHASMVMKARDISGATYIPLSPDSLYSWIDNGVDEGSDPADAITALESKGICTLADVPDNFILASAISSQAMANALRFRIVSAGVYSCSSFAELVTADYLGFATTLTINVGNNFGPDSSGLVGFAAGVANHCVSGGEAMRTVSGVKQYRIRNSWNTSWGVNGCAWITSKYIDQQPDVEMFALQWMPFDPQDVLNPPVAA